ncbi:MAG: hypothetical protein AAFY73_02630 [Pseudomonadota bacterium]
MDKDSKTPEATNGAAAPQTIDQVRELLSGAEQRTFEDQLSKLRADMQAMQSDLEGQLKNARKELSDAVAKADTDHKARLAEVGSAIEEVGRAIGSIANR